MEPDVDYGCIGVNALVNNLQIRSIEYNAGPHRPGCLMLRYDGEDLSNDEIANIDGKSFDEFIQKELLYNGFSTEAATDFKLDNVEVSTIYFNCGDVLTAEIQEI